MKQILFILSALLSIAEFSFSGPNPDEPEQKRDKC